MAKSNRLERAIIAVWTLLVIFVLCDLALLIFRGWRVSIVALVGVLLTFAAFVVSNFVKDDFPNIAFSGRAKGYHALAMLVVLALCLCGAVFVYLRPPLRSGNVYGLNLYRDAGFNRSEPIDIRQNPPINPPHRPTYPCPDAGADECTNIIFAGDITNDTEGPITGVSFTLSAGGKDFSATFQWDDNCYSNPITIKSGQTQFIAFRIPAFPMKLLEEYGRENRAPTLIINDTTNRRLNVVNKESESDQTVRRQSESLVKIYYQCSEQYNDGTWPPPNLDMQVLNKSVIDAVRYRGIPVADEKTTLDWAHAVCTTLQDQQNTLDDAVVNARRDQPYLSASDAGYFVGAAAKAFCPRELDQRQHHS